MSPYFKKMSCVLIMNMLHSTRIFLHDCWQQQLIFLDSFDCSHQKFPLHIQQFLPSSTELSSKTSLSCCRTDLDVVTSGKQLSLGAYLFSLLQYKGNEKSVFICIHPSTVISSNKLLSISRISLGLKTSKKEWSPQNNLLNFGKVYFITVSAYA